MGGLSKRHAVPQWPQRPQNAIPLTIDASGAWIRSRYSRVVFTVDPLPLEAGFKHQRAGTAAFDHHRSAAPGFRSDRLHPSGFFNSGARAGVSGFRQLQGPAAQGWWNQAHAALAGAGSGRSQRWHAELRYCATNVGSRNIKGCFAPYQWVWGLPALVSGAGNVGQQLSGVGGRDNR